jgi:hypothetical protein
LGKRGEETLSSAGGVIFVSNVSSGAAFEQLESIASLLVNMVFWKNESESDFPEKLDCYRDFQEDGHVLRKLPGIWTTHLRVHRQSTSASLMRH